MAWTCPNCLRSFRRIGQSHECAPALSLEEYFSTGPEWEQPIFEAVLAHLQTLGPMTVEPVSVGIFIKADGSFVELRPLSRWVALSFPLMRRVSHPRVARNPIESGRKFYHIVNLQSPQDVDDQVKSWLSESFDALAGA